jgi:hypothetical protein
MRNCRNTRAAKTTSIEIIWGLAPDQFDRTGRAATAIQRRYRRLFHANNQGSGIRDRGFGRVVSFLVRVRMIRFSNPPMLARQTFAFDFRTAAGNDDGLVRMDSYIRGR